MSAAPATKGSVVVTGAASGIGFATTGLLLAEGYRVVACDLAPGRLAELDSPDLHFDALDVRDAAASRARPIWSWTRRPLIVTSTSI